MKKIKILQTPIRFFPYIGGVENHVYYLSKELVKLGDQVKILCARVSNENANFVNGVVVERLKYQFKITNTNISLQLPFKIWKNDFDIVHTHMPTPWTSDWSVLLAKMMNKKSIITVHNDMDKSSFLSKLITKLYLNTVFKLTLKLVDRIIIVNPDWENSFISTKKLLQKHVNKITLVPNGINLELFKSIKKINKKKDIVLFVSILDKHHSFKGLSYLLLAIKKIVRSNPNIELHVVGEGELKKQYQLEAQELGIEKNVKFIGEIKQEQLSRFYNQSSVFVLPSTEIEGFGIVLLEAMACKLPVIATNIVGVAIDIKKYRTGLIVPPKDIFALEKAIIKVLIDKELSQKMAENGRKLVEEKYTWEKIAKNIQSIYLSVNKMGAI